MATPEQIRAEQNEFGRSTLGLPNKPRTYVPGQGAARAVRAKKPSVPKKPEGHEALLKALEVTGGKVRVEFLDDDYTFEGVVKHSDKFTISVQQDDNRPMVIFKHAMRGFVVLSDPPSMKKEAAALEA